jgi:hypothetical protein
VLAGGGGLALGALVIDAQMMRNGSDDVVGVSCLLSSIEGAERALHEEHYISTRR